MGTALAFFYGREGRDIGSEPKLWCVTGRLTVNYRKPTPMGQAIELSARVIDSSERKAVVETVVMSGGDVVAEGETIAVLVRDGWQNGRDA